MAFGKLAVAVRQKSVGIKASDNIAAIRLVRGLQDVGMEGGESCCFLDRQQRFNLILEAAQQAATRDG